MAARNNGDIWIEENILVEYTKMTRWNFYGKHPHWNVISFVLFNLIFVLNDKKKLERVKNNPAYVDVINFKIWDLEATAKKFLYVAFVHSRF